jgi:hypothetical protein
MEEVQGRENRATPGQQLTERKFKLIHRRFPNGSAYSLAYRRKSRLDCEVYYTFCSAKDQFSRTMAHRVLLGRAEKGKRAILVTLPDTYPKMVETLRREFEALVISGQLSAPAKVQTALTRRDKADE